MTRRLQPSSLHPRSVLLALSVTLAAWLPGATVDAREPSKSETIKFIVDKVNQQGTVNVAGFLHDNATGKDSIVRQSFEQTKLEIEPKKPCRLTYHKKILVNGTATVDSDFWAALGGVDKVEVISMEQAWKRADSRAGNTTLSYKADPPITIVRLNVSNGNYYELAFYEADLANRVGKAFEHIVDMCGGGKEVF